MKSELLLQQLTATCHVRYLEKKRSPSVTCCEYFSHMIIVLLLLMGYGLSIVENYPGKIYSQVDIMIPPAYVEDQSVDSMNIATTLNNVLEGPLTAPDLNTYLSVTNTLSEIAGGVGGLVNTVLRDTAVGQLYGNLFIKGSLHLAPAGPLVNSFLAYLNETTPNVWDMKIYIHDDENKGIQYILDHIDERTFAFVVLREVSVHKVNYVIRMNYTTLPNTNELVSYFTLGLDAQYQSYFLSGFLSVQSAVDKWVFDVLDDVSVVYYNSTIIDEVGLLDAWRSNNSNQLDDVLVDVGLSREAPKCVDIGYVEPNRVAFAPLPTYKYDQNPFFAAVGFLLGMAMTMATMYPMSRFVKSMVEDKESRMREVMKVMGLSSSMHQLSWILTGAIVFVWIAVSTTFICNTTFLANSDTWLLFLYFLTFCLSEVSLSFLLSSFFSNSKLAAIVAPVALFCLLMPRYVFFSTNNNEQYVPKLLASLSSPVAFAFGADYIANAEYVGAGLQYSNANTGQYNFITSVQMMAFDSVLYLLLALYMDLVLPQEFGTPLPWWFPFSINYWMGKPLKSTWSSSSSLDGNPQKSLPPECVYNQEGVQMQAGYEALESRVAHDTIEGLSMTECRDVKAIIQNLVKTYPNGKLAVKDLSFAMVENQITCLLGHNGAGKSTTVSILTGLLQPSAGDVDIYGYNLASQLDEIRQITGVCPQHDVLFPTLTVLEHLNFFGSIKGLTGEALQLSVDRIIMEVGLTEKRNVQSRSLSGGMKRKLCLAMALVGNPKIVLLDEPTSGMDPYSRRSTWEILKKCKQNRVVVLTTHFMDEADILGDRIVIMAHGELQCSGSSLFLKNRFGAGYVLTLTRVQGSAGNMMASSKQINHVVDAVKSVIPDASFSSSVAGEIVLQLPIAATPLFPNLFKYLEDNSKSLNICSYGVSITSLEQVFIYLANRQHIVHDKLQATEDDAIYNDMFGYLSKVIFPLCGRLFHAFSTNFTTATPLASNQSKINAVGDEEVVEMVPSDTDKNMKLGVDENKGVQHIPAYTHVPLAENGGQDGNNELKVNLDVPVCIHSQEHGQESGYTSKDKAAPGVDNFDSSKKQGEGVLRSFIASLFTWNYLNTLYGGAELDPEGEGDTDQDLENSTMMDFNRYYVQFVELFRKRYIIATRDLKGFFFQVLFPSLQILAVLAILTIRLNISGHTIRLVTASYEEVPDVVLVGNALNVYKDPLLADIVTNPNVHAFAYDNYSVVGVEVEGSAENVETSTNLSYRFLWQVDDPDPELELLPQSDNFNRLGAYVFDDRIPFNITVSWPWVGGLLNGDSPNSTVLNSVLDYFGLTNETYVYGPVTVTLADLFDLTDNGVSGFIPSLWTNVTSDALDNLLQIAFDLTFANATVGDILSLLNVSYTATGNETYVMTFHVPFLNQTISVEVNENVFNLTEGLIDDINDGNVTDIVSINDTLTIFSGNLNLTISMQNSTLSVGQIYVDVADREVIFSDISVELLIYFSNDTESSTVLELDFENNITITVGDVVSILPNDTMVYRFDIPSSTTILHNSSSPHGVAIFQGDLLQGKFKECSPLNTIIRREMFNGTHSSDVAAVLIYPFVEFNSSQWKSANTTKGDGAADYDRTMAYLSETWGMNRNIVETLGNLGGIGLSDELRSYGNTDNLQYFVKNHPLPITAQQSLEIQVILSVFTSLFMLVPLCYIPAAFVTFVVKERAVKATHLQFVSSVSPYMYWLATYCWDMVLYVILASCIMFTTFAYGQQASSAFTGSSLSSLTICALLLSYGLSAIPLSYIYSFGFSNHSTAQISIMTLNFITGFVMVLAYFIMVNIPSTMSAARTAVVFFRIFPPYNIGEGFINISRNYYINNLLDGNTSPFAWSVAGRNIVFMLLEAGGYLGIVLLSENSYLKNMMHSLEKQRVLSIMSTLGYSTSQRDDKLDIDVRNEKTRIEAVASSIGPAASDDILYINGLIKTYPPSLVCGGVLKRAVRGISLGCKRNEIFGLLGINGAGKVCC